MIIKLGRSHVYYSSKKDRAWIRPSFYFMGRHRWLPLMKRLPRIVGTGVSVHIGPKIYPEQS